MSEFRKLQDSLIALDQSISEFPIGAVCIDDLRPIEEKVFMIRESLKNLNSRLLTLKAKNETQIVENLSKTEFENIVDLIHTAAAASIIHNKAIKLCLHSATIQSIFYGREGDSDMQKKICSYMCDLFTQNDDLIHVQQCIETVFYKQLDLKIQCQKSIYDYDNFLKEQEEIRRKRLQETNPEIAKNKEKMEKTLRKINVMKRLITNFIATSSHMLKDNPYLAEMFEEHREIINVETILKMSQNNPDVTL